MDAPDSAASRLAAAAALLEASGDYRVLRRFLPHDEFAPVPPGVTPRRALVIDTETTGADPRSDQLIELALLAFDFDPQSGAIYGVTGVYDGFDDPGRPIPAEAMAIHGITDQMVAGQALDEPRVEAMLEGAEWVIAHNAAFDRPILERRMPQFRALRWACSNVDVPWAAEGFSGSKLQYLATQQGFFFEGHRSEIDCRALLEVLSRPLLKSGTAPLGVLLRTAAQPRLRFRTEWSMTMKKRTSRNGTVEIPAPNFTPEAAMPPSFAIASSCACSPIAVACAAELSWLVVPPAPMSETVKP
jgi:DNA polymerase-3 subunit epsilon